MMRRATTSGRQAIESPGALQRNPFVDQGAGIGAGDARFGRAQVAQPAEPEQHFRPFLGRRQHLEWRAAVADHDLAGEGEAAGIDLAGAGRVGGAQVLRRDQQPVGAGRGKTPADAADARSLARWRPAARDAPRTRRAWHVPRSARGTWTGSPPHVAGPRFPAPP